LGRKKGTPPKTEGKGGGPKKKLFLGGSSGLQTRFGKGKKKPVKTNGPSSKNKRKPKQTKLQFERKKKKKKKKK